MIYSEVLDFLFSQLPMYQRTGGAAYKADLSTTIQLDEYFNHPHYNFKTIHVAGTNGKGSVSHMLASVLQKTGYKTGLYTSPHLVDFRERIKINGNMIPENEVIEFVKNHQDIITDLKPSFFEMSVAMAFDYFAKEKIDIAVVEVGMGGRLDSTNIISPLMSIITNIGFDHTAFLGDTLEKIASEKAGIIKENTPVIIGKTQSETKPVFISTAKSKNAEIVFADEFLNCNYSTLTLDNKQSFNIYNDDILLFENLKTDLLGIYQKENIITVLTSLLKLNLNIKQRDIYNGILNAAKNTGLRGRWEILNHSPLTICDTGHNIDGIQQIIKQIENTAYKKLHIIIGFVNDKNFIEILNLLPKNAQYYFTQPSIPRALDVNILFNSAQNLGLKGEKYPTVKTALNAVNSVAQKEDLIFIGGSTFIVADIF